MAVFLLCVGAALCFAADLFVRVGGTGNGTGNWSTAASSYSGLASIAAGDTVWIAGGTYGGSSWNLVTSSVTLRRATAAVHGTDTGWNADWGTTPVTFSGIGITITNADDVTIDGGGLIGGEPGMAIDRGAGGANDSCVEVVISTGDTANNATIQYVDFRGSGANDGVRDTPYATTGTSTGLTVRYCAFRNLANGASLRGQSLMRVSGARLYGNVFRSSTGIGVLMTLASDTGLYNNVFAQLGTALSVLNASTATVQNNILFQNTTADSIALSGTGVRTITHNWYTDNTNQDQSDGETGGDPFVDADPSDGTFDYHIKAPTGAGTATSHATDPDGITRGGDGVWDKGAYEFEISELRIHDAEGDSGQVLAAQDMDAGEELTVWAAGFYRTKEDPVFYNNVDVEWSWSDPAFDRADFEPPDPAIPTGESVTFSPDNAGSTTITATYTAGSVTRPATSPTITVGLPPSFPTHLRLSTDGTNLIDTPLVVDLPLAEQVTLWALACDGPPEVNKTSVAVAWTMSGDYPQSALVPASDGKSATLTVRDPGAARLTIDDANGLPAASIDVQFMQDTTGIANTASVVLVLDKSGSMSMVSGTGGATRKIEALRSATELFVEEMRKNINNNLGMVRFNQDVLPFADVQQDGETYSAGLSALTAKRGEVLTQSFIPLLSAGGMTSIGDGLALARDQLAAKPPEHAGYIVLVSDGMENTPLMVAQVIGSLSAYQIHAIGFGESSGGIWENTLQDIASAGALGSTVRFRPGENDLRKFFGDSLATIMHEQQISDPDATIARREVVEVPFVISENDAGVTFTAVWQNLDRALHVSLVSPSGMRFRPTDRNSRIVHKHRDRYAFYQLTFPLSGSLHAERAGVWKLRIEGVQRRTDPPVAYATAGHVSGETTMEASFEKNRIVTGEAIKVSTTIKRAGLPVRGAKVHVVADIPAISPGNVIARAVAGFDPAAAPVVEQDPISPTAYKAALIRKASAIEPFARRGAELDLYDDATHGDATAEDGVYTALFEDTKAAGTYTFRFMASELPAGGDLKTTREWSQSFYNEVDIQPEHSAVSVRFLGATKDGNRYLVRVTPADRFGNILGTERSVNAALVPRDYELGQEVSVAGMSLADLVNGTYEREISVTPAQLNAGSRLLLKVAGKDFVLRRISAMEWSWSLHAGLLFPVAGLAPAYRRGVGGLADLTWSHWPVLAPVLLAGGSYLPSTTTGVPDAWWVHATGGVKVTPLATNPAPYAIATIGPYVTASAPMLQLGLTYGGGLMVGLAPRVTVEASALLHSLFTSGLTYAGAYAGVSVRF